MSRHFTAKAVRLDHRHKAILNALFACRRPMRHAEIVRALPRPWYSNARSFAASVSSTLCSLRDMGAVEDYTTTTGTIIIRGIAQPRIDRRWAMSAPFRERWAGRPDSRLVIIKEVSTPMFQHEPRKPFGGAIIVTPPIASATLPSGLIAPRSPDMSQMIDDIDAVELTPMSASRCATGGVFVSLLIHSTIC